MPVLSSHKRCQFFALIVSLVAVIAGCATQQSTTVWRSGDQFVSVVNRDDMGTGQSVPNRQPVSLPAGALRAELAPLAVQLPDDAKPTALFGDDELVVLSEQLHAGLEQAGKDQDLVFAVRGAKPLWKLFGSLPVVTTGRVFYRDNGLNLILGKVRAEIHGDDRRLDPFVPGSRLRAASLPGPILAGSAEAAHVPDRPDWLVLTVGSEPKAQPVTVKPDAGTPAATPPVSGKEAAPAARQGGSAATAAGKVAERLKVLDELKAKGLITDEEYRAKRKSILDEI